ncbi:MAG: DUF86 domain-containing protein [Calditrichaeota bacterium]|nr:DUF86 domain-containing protein [Calditrichota bacterium]MCB9369359.1 DUF86 domain-containing protein [Calditrichota bacterium]
MWRDRAHLESIAQSCERIVGKTLGRTFEDFANSEDLHDIVALHIAIIGESARKLSDETKEKLSEIPWHKVIGMRNRIAHDYKATDSREIWIAATRDIPELLVVVSRELDRP